jgi:dephospho-CoA kinase
MALDRLGSVCDYNETIFKLTNLLEERKEKLYKDEAMLIGIAGLSQSGKTRISSSLEQQLKGAIVIDGDKYQPGREKGMPIYEKLSEDVRAGRNIDLEFHRKVWNYDAMQAQLLDPVFNFNNSGKKETTLELKDVIDTATKRSDSLHNEEYSVNRSSTILVPSMFLRHLHDKFHYLILLEITPEESINRKIDNLARKGVKRDPKLTSDMVNLIEYPAMEYQKQKYQISNGISLNTTNFDSIY